MFIGKRIALRAVKTFVEDAREEWSFTQILGWFINQGMSTIIADKAAKLVMRRIPLGAIGEFVIHFSVSLLSFRMLILSEDEFLNTLEAMLEKYSD